MVGTFLSLSLLEGFPYWFNLGQPPHNPRMTKFFEPSKIVFITSSWHFYLGILFVFLILFNKIKNPYKKKLISLFLIIAITQIVSNILSGSTRQLSVMGTPVLIFFVYLLIKDHIPELRDKYKLLLGTILVLLLMVNVNPFPTYGLITLNYMNPKISRVQEGCVAGIPMHKDSFEGLQEIREIIKKNPNFISLTEYTFLYCDYNIKPPRKIPMTFREGIHFYMEDFDDIINTIISNNPDIILIQNVHGHDVSIHQLTINTFISKGYKEMKIIEKTETPDAPITILKKVS